MPSPLAIQRPASVEALSEAVQNAAKSGYCVQVAGSNSLPLTAFADAARPVQVLSTTRLNKIVEHAVADMTVIVQAGMTLEALQKELAWRNQWLPIDPPIIGAQWPPRPSAGVPQTRLPGTRTLGGLIASNSLGPLRFGIGDWRLLIMGMKWLDSTGQLIKGGGRTVKNVAGYSIPRLLVGSCGSLGVITEITLRTFARPADERSLLVYCSSAAAAEKLLAEIMVAPVTPAYLQVIGKSAFGSNPLELPRAGEGMIVVAGFLGRAEVCAAQVEILRQVPAAAGAEKLSLTAAQSGRLRLWMTTEPALQGAGAGFRLHVKSSQVAAIVEQLENATAQSGADAWLVSEAGTGLVRGMVTGKDAATLVRKIATDFGGILAFTHGVPLVPRTDPLYANLKSAMDANRLFGDATE